MNSIPVDLVSLQAVVIAVLDLEGVLLQANAGFLHLLPEGAAPAIGAKAAQYFIQPSFAELSKAGQDGDPDGYRGLLTIGDYAGRTRTLRGRAWRTGTEVRVLAEYDIAELERLADSMQALNRESSVARHALTRSNVAMKQRQVRILAESLTDALTGVGNRRHFDAALAAELSRVSRNGGALSAIMADVDHFKRVNDEYGHPAGDKVLARLGALFSTRTRPTDTVARFGGEEFLVLMPHTALAEAAAKAEQLRIALAAEIIEPLPRGVTASFGVAQLGNEEEGAAFLARVDAALYKAKADGRNRVVSAVPATRKAA